MDTRTVGVRRVALGLSARTIIAVCLLMVVVVVGSIVVAAFVMHDNLTVQYEERALSIARAVAQTPGLGDRVRTTAPAASGSIQQDAEGVRVATHALYVVVTNRDGIRFSHPDPTKVGKLVSTGFDSVLAGNEVVTVERGTLGDSARGKVPLRDSRGVIVGEVSVGIDTDEINARTRVLVQYLALFALVPLAIGMIGAARMGRGLRTRTLGLDPLQMADLVREHEAVLWGIRDGIVAVDQRGRVTLTNPEADRLLDRTVARGDRLADADPVLASLMSQDPAPMGSLCVLFDRAVLATKLPVRRDGKDLGDVLILRDRSDLDSLAGELEATRALTDALRAQAHEHKNRLHSLSSLLHLERWDEARDYVEEITEARTWVPGLADPYLAGLIAAKSAQASEAGVSLVLADDMWVNGDLARPLETVTVVANLLDNAIRAAAQGDRRPATVELALLADGSDLLVDVADSGEGISDDLVDSVFDHGFTTRSEDAADHGIGLSLARHTARVHGGDLVLREQHGRLGGAVFAATLRRAVVTGPRSRRIGS